MKTIDITPNWEAAMQIYILCLEHGNEKGKAAARSELLKLARYVDQLNKQEDSK